MMDVRARSRERSRVAAARDLAQHLDGGLHDHVLHGPWDAPHGVEDALGLRGVQTDEHAAHGFDERAEVGRIRLRVEEHDGDGAFPVVRVRQTPPLRGQMQEDARVVRGDVAADQVRMVRRLDGQAAVGLVRHAADGLDVQPVGRLARLPGQERLLAWQGEHGQVGGERDPQAVLRATVRAVRVPVSGLASGTARGR